MEGKVSRIFRSGNRTRGNKDGERESKRSLGVADTEVYQGHTEILRTGELLPSVY